MATEKFQQQVPAIQPTQLVPDTASMANAQQWKEMAKTADYFQNYGFQIAQQDALEKAAEDAPKLLTRDGQGVLVPPADLGAFGGGPLYSRQIRRSATELYKQQAGADMQAAADEASARFPNDPAAVIKFLGDKRDLMLKGIDPALRSSVEPWLEMTIGQAASRTLARKIGADRAVLARSAEQAERNLVTDLVGSSTAEIKIADRDPQGRIVTREAYKGRIESYRETLRGLQMTPDQIEEAVQNLDHKVRRRVAENAIYATIAGPGYNPQNPEANYTAERNARTFIKGWLAKNGDRPGDRAYLEQSLSDASQHIRLLGAASAAELQRLADIERVDQARKQQQYEQTPPSDQRTQDMIAWRRARFAEIVDNDRYTPAVKASLLPGLIGDGPQVRQSYQDVGTQAVSTLRSAEATPTDKSFAEGQITTLINDPGFYRNVGAAGVNALRSSLEEYRLGQIGLTTLPQLTAQGSRGAYSPAELDKIYRENSVGSPGRPAMFGTGPGQINPVDWKTRIEPTYVEAYKKRIALGDRALQAQAGWHNDGTQPVGDDAAAIMEQQGVKPVYTATTADGKVVEVPPDPANPAHREQASALYWSRGVVDPRMKEELAKVASNLASSPEAKDGLKQMVAAYEQIYALKQARGVKPETLRPMFDGWVETNLGGEVKKYNDALRRGYTDITDMHQYMNKKNEAAQRLFGGTQEKLDQTYDEMTKNFTAAGAKGATPSLITQFATLGLSTMFNDKELAALYKPFADSGILNAGNYHKVTYSPEAQQALRERTYLSINRNGTNEKAFGGDPMRIGFIKAMQNLGDEFGVETGPDGNPVITFKPMNMVINQKMGTGQKFSEQETNDLGVAMARDRYNEAVKAGGVLPQIDWKTGKWITQTVGENTYYSFMALGTDKTNSVPYTLYSIDARDPMISASMLRFLREGRDLVKTPGMMTWVNNMLGGTFDAYLLNSRTAAAAAFRSGRDPGPEMMTDLMVELAQYQKRIGLETPASELMLKLDREELRKRVSLMPWYDFATVWMQTHATRGLRRFGEAGPQAGPPATPPTPIPPAVPPPATPDPSAPAAP